MLKECFQCCKNQFSIFFIIEKINFSDFLGQSDYPNSVDQFAESSSSPSSLSSDIEQRSLNVNNTDVSNLELQNKNSLIIASDTNQQSDSLKVNNATPDNNMFSEDVYSSDDDLYISAEEVNCDM